MLGPVERFLYRIAGVKPDDEMDWKRYALAMLLFNFVGFLLLYTLQRLQGALPANPAHLPAVAPDLSFNTAISFVTNTNWQSYSGEQTMSYLTQMFGLAVQNFLSAASGMAVLVALIRGIRAANDLHGRQLLGRHGAGHAVHPAAALAAACARPGLAGRGADVLARTRRSRSSSPCR